MARYEHVANTPALDLQARQLQLPAALRRAGEMYEAKGDRKKALDYYGRFVDLWKDADPELQPGVDAERMVARRDHPWQHQAAETHPAHVDTEEHAEREAPNEACGLIAVRDGVAEVRFADRKSGIASSETLALVAPLTDSAEPVRWSTATPASFDLDELEKEAAGNARFESLPHRRKIVEIAARILDLAPP